MQHPDYTLANKTKKTCLGMWSGNLGSMVQVKMNQNSSKRLTMSRKGHSVNALSPYFFLNRSFFFVPFHLHSCMKMIELWRVLQQILYTCGHFLCKEKHMWEQLENSKATPWFRAHTHAAYGRRPLLFSLAYWPFLCLLLLSVPIASL